MNHDRQTVVILGAGINGCALARELALNDLAVLLVEKFDVAGGTTAYSSRLIHGGLRYLEYGEFDLVRESLAERGRLLRLAPHLVRPLELCVPIRHRTSGVWPALRRFVGWESGDAARQDRGLWLVQAGLWLYDLYARDPQLPRHRVLASGEGPPVDRERYRWLASYYDAQVEFPERLTLALLADAQQIARERGNQVRLLTYHEARLVGTAVEIRRAEADAPVLESLEPAAVVNATGAWVDRTLASLQPAGRRLIGGTKGSHLLTAREELRVALGGRGIYAEAADGRPIFILPLGEMVLVGTTDDPYEDDPYQAVASDEELEYLLSAVHDVFPQVVLRPADIAFSYSGVRPLPFIDSASPAAVTRRHLLRRHTEAPLPLFSIVGGKLTTCRSLAEEAAAEILPVLGAPLVANSRERPIPGGESYPSTHAALGDEQQQLAAYYAMPLEAVRAVWRLCGTRTRSVLAQADPADRQRLLAQTPLPWAVVRWSIRNEWATRLDDLVERRLMLLYRDRLTRACLNELADLLVAEGRLSPADRDVQVQLTIGRLRQHFGKAVLETAQP